MSKEAAAMKKTVDELRNIAIEYVCNCDKKTLELAIAWFERLRFAKRARII